MSTSPSDVVGLMEMDLSEEELRIWLETDAEISLPEATPPRFHIPPTTSTVIIANAEQLSADLRNELLRMLQQLR